MDRFEGCCWLDWWANSSTILATIEVSLTIEATDAGWDAHGQLTNDDDQEQFAFLRDLDPISTLRFDNDSTIAVTATPTASRRFTLTEYTGPARRPIDHRIEL